MKSITIADNEKYLRQISVNVDISNDKKIEENIKLLEEYCKENEVMAMAAVQLGIPKRLVYLKNTNLDIISKSNDELTNEEKNYNEARVLINPVIITREGLTEYWEACASCLDNCGLVLRPYKIDLEYYDILGNKHSEIFEGFESTVLSHEMDHLDGVLHIDVSEKLLYIPAEERVELRKKHPYKIYSKTGSYDILKNELSRKNNKIKEKNRQK